MIPGVPRPCVECGAPCEGSRCEEHEEHRAAATSERRGSARARGYDAAWDRLSRRARARQNFCSLCCSTVDVSTDHLPSAWWRAERGLPITLADVQVLCAVHQAELGSSRPGSRRYVAWESSVQS